MTAYNSKNIFVTIEVIHTLLLYCYIYYKNNTLVLLFCYYCNNKQNVCPIEK
jgi:hypothetical protein